MVGSGSGGSGGDPVISRFQFVRSRSGVAVNGLFQVFGGMNDAICGSDSGDRDSVVQEGECVCGAYGSCVGNDSDAAVVVEGGGKIPRFDGVVSPCVSTTWLDMYHTFGADGCHWGCTEREDALHSFVC